QFGLVELKDRLAELLHNGANETLAAPPVGGILATEEELERALAALWSPNLDTKRSAIHLLKDYRYKPAAARIETLTNTADHPELSRDAFIALYEIDPDKALAPLLSYRGVENAEQFIVRETAVALLGNYRPEKDVFDKVRRLIRDPMWGVQVAVCEALGKWR